MKVLVLGGSGMLGSQVHRIIKSDMTTSKDSNVLDPTQQLALLNLCGEYDVVINCIGIVKQNDATVEDVIRINSLFPHKLAKSCKRLIHISTDCVYSGGKGNYKETDRPDPIDVYGRSKLLGEPEKGLTLRTSIIGHSKNNYSLVDWFMNQTEVEGYRNAIFSGFTTIELSRIIKRILDYPELEGVYHCAGYPIDKYTLLCMIDDIYNLGVTIYKNKKFKINRSLNAERLEKEIGPLAKSWRTMIEEMKLQCLEKN